MQQLWTIRNAWNERLIMIAPEAALNTFFACRSEAIHRMKSECLEHGHCILHGNGRHQDLIVRRFDVTHDLKGLTQPERNS